MSSLGVVDDFGHILRYHAYFQFLHRQDIAVAYYEIDVIQRDAFGRQTVIDDLLIKTGIVLFARYPLFGDRVGNFTISKQTCADVMVVRIDPKYIDVLFRHCSSSDREAMYRPR